MRLTLAQLQGPEMKRSRSTDDQIIGIPKERQIGVSVADLCRKHGVSDATVYKWKARYGRQRGKATEGPAWKKW